MGIIVGLGDSHFWEGSPRFAECLRIHRWIAEWIAEHKPDLVVHGGDIYERNSDPDARNSGNDWAISVADEAPLLIVRGNHDAPRDLLGYEKLRAKHRIRVVESAGVKHLRTDSGTAIAIAAMAWPRREYVAALCGLSGKETVEQTAQALLRQALTGLGSELREHWSGVPKLFVGHVMVRGSQTSVGSELVGTDMELGLDDLGLVGADAYHLSHVHMHQAFSVGGAPALYPGAPFRSTFGEIEPKGFVVYHHDGKRITGWEFIETPATPQVLVYAEWSDVTVGTGGEPEPAGFGWQDLQHETPGEWARGAEVRFRYAVEYDQRAAAKNAERSYVAQLREAGAVSIKVEDRVVQRTRARAPEIGHARTLVEKLEAHWRSSGFDPGDRRESLLRKLGQLEEEDRNAA